MDSDKYQHFLYQSTTEGEADAVAWVFLSKDEFVKFPYKLPEVEEDEVRAIVTYTGLCLSDSLHGRSRWGYCPYPVATGHEIIGIVSKVGSNVTSFKPGDKVAFGVQRDCCDTCKYCVRDYETLCQNVDDKFTYGIHWGGYNTHIQQPAKFFFKVSEDLDEKRAAPLLCAGITVYQPIKQYARPGDNAAVIGIGGLGHLGLQFLHKLGFKVTAFSSTLDKVDMIKSFGADHVINYKDESEMKKHYDKYDFIINTLPIGDNFNSFLNLAAPKAVFVQVGLPDAGINLQVSPEALITKEISLIGSLIGSRKNISEMLDICVKHDIYPVCEEFNFDEFPKALDRLENGRPKFRCVVNVQEYSKRNNLFK